MPGSNITRTYAAERAALLRVDSYDVRLDLAGAPDGAETFRSRTEIRFTSNQPGSTTTIDIIAARFHEVVLNGKPVDTSTYDKEKGLELTDLAADNELLVDAECFYMNTGEGMHRTLDPADNETYLYTQFESREAHRVYACFDQPDLKARFSLTVTAPTHWKVFSNGVSSNDNGTWTFTQTVPISTYITAIVAGPYVGVQDEHDGIPLGVYARRSMEQYLDADELLTITKQGFDFFHQAFDYRYPFGKYDQIFVAEFNAGAMENAGCVTHSDDYMLFRGKQTRARYEQRANTIMHEMAHMWFGNLVTMRWWDDLWLNESFAEWAGASATGSATQYTDSWTNFCTLRKAWGMRQDQLSSTHPVATEAPDVVTAELNFDGITYAKGASLLKQLVKYVGQDAFLAALRSYFKAHAYGNATLTDLLTELEAASGRDLKTWATKWIQTAGINTLRPVVTVDNEGNYSSVVIEQTAIPEHPTLRPHRMDIGLYDETDSGLVRRDVISLDVDGAATEVSALIGIKQPALLLLNEGDHTYAKLRLDERSQRAVVDNVSGLGDPLARALVWAAAWDSNRDAELATRHYITMAVNGLPNEDAVGILQAQLGFALAALANYADPAWRSAGYWQLADAAWAATIAAEPGSDVQLIWARTFASAARTPESLAKVTGLLRGSEVVPGLAIDTELRWHLVQQAVAHGALGPEAIEAELQRDNTDAGARAAATARAMVPTAEAKAQAWKLAVEEATTGNRVALAVMRGFALSEHSDLLKPYVEKYFAVLNDVWQNRTSEVAANITEWLYPSWDVSPELVNRTEEYLVANPDALPAQRRLVAEGRDAVLRALAARACDRMAV
ncbi:MAG: aminopeptidase N [Corynebacteriales bacterium]|nr:aminopeptidase N [Mycobacteriales bacterium]